MKICYINGYGGYESSKPKILKSMICEEINHIKINYDDFKFEEFEEIKNFDLVIASSLGTYFSSYYCSIYNKPRIAISPIVDIAKTKSRIDKKISIPEKFKKKYELEQLVLFNKDDELHDFKKTFAYFFDISIMKMFVTGGHRFDNLIEAKDDINKFIYSIGI